MMLSVIIPAYNEKPTIETIIDRVRHVACLKQIIVVDDGSTDGTRDILKRLSQQDPATLTCLYHSSNRGKGAAIKTALAHASGDVIVIQDADVEYDPQDFLRCSSQS